MGHFDLKYFISKSEKFYKIDFYKFNEVETIDKEQIHFKQSYQFIISGNEEVESFNLFDLFKDAYISYDTTIIYKKTENYLDFILKFNDTISRYFKKVFKYLTITNPDYFKLIRLNNINYDKMTINDSKISYAVHINGKEYYEYVNPFLMVNIAFCKIL